VLKNVLRVIVCIFLVCSFSETYADTPSLEWIEPHQFPLRHRINLEQLTIEKESKIHEWVKVNTLHILNEDLIALKNKFYFGDSFRIKPDVIRFAIQGTGFVFDFNQTTNTLTRVDNTKHSGYNFSAIRFYRNHVLYSVGGEGFWSYNKHITYFDEHRSKEWEIFRTKNKGPEVISTGYQGYSKKADVFFSGGAIKKDFLINENFEELTDFYQFDFATKSWEKLGEINSILASKTLKVVYWNGSHFVQLANDKVYFIDPIKNSIHVFQDNATYFEDGSNYFISNDSIIYFKNASEGPFQIIPVNSLLKKASYIGKFYAPNNTLWYIGIAIFLAAGIITFGIIQWRKNRQPKFNEIELKLLTFLVTSKGKLVTTYDINDLLECSHKSQESQRRIRHLIINQINTKLDYNYQIKNAIERIPSEEDKRIVNYQLNIDTIEKIQKIVQLKG